jgi:hypothetical protein
VRALAVLSAGAMFWLLAPVPASAGPAKAWGPEPLARPAEIPQSVQAEPPPMEPASADGCTWAEGNPGAYVCIRVLGSGLHADYVSVRRFNPGANICGYSARVDAWWNGYLIEVDYGDYHPGCTPAWAYVEIPSATGWWPNHTWLCGAWYEGGRWIRGYPCVEVHS